MMTILIVISILLIILVLLQAGKAESVMSALAGSNESLFKNRKERGGELFITRLTFFLGLAFFIICMYFGF